MLFSPILLVLSCGFRCCCLSAVVTVLWIFCGVRLFCCQVYSVVLWCVLSRKVGVTISHTPALRQHGGGPRGASVSEGGGPSCRDRRFGTVCSGRKNIRQGNNRRGSENSGLVVNLSSDQGSANITPCIRGGAAWTDRGVLRQEPIYTERGK